MVGMPIFNSIYYAHISEELIYYVHISEEAISFLPHHFVAGHQDYHFSDSPHQLWSRYRFSLKTKLFLILVGWDVGVVVPRVVSRRVLCFRFPHAEFALPTNFLWKPSTYITLPLSGQGSVMSFWTLDGHVQNLSISTTINFINMNN